jgi:hypothetical protein
MPNGSPSNIAAALARIAELMGPEDVLVLYTTSHGGPFGIVYNDADAGFGIIGPAKLASMLGELHIRNRMLLISACYSGVFVAPLMTSGTAILTAASTDRTSFGCKADSDWTFFGDALINHAPKRLRRSPGGNAPAAWSLHCHNPILGPMQHAGSRHWRKPFRPQRNPSGNPQPTRSSN